MEFTERRLAQEAQFADEHYRPYSEQLAVNPGMFQKYSNPHEMWDWRQYGMKLLGNVNGASLLDLGCGMGEETTYFALLGACVTAIDISSVGVELAHRRAEYNGVGDRVVAQQTRADQTPFPDGSFDVVHGFGILHHISMERGMAETKRLLKPGGRALFFEHMGNSRLIERIRQRSDYTDYEKPLEWKEIMSFQRDFSKFHVKAFHVVRRLRSIVSSVPQRTLKKWDYQLLNLCPPLRHFASGVVIYVEK